MEQSKRIGILGEEFTAQKYRSMGYDVLTANYNTRYGEIDIVFEKDDVVVICEVKTRTNTSYTMPREAVTLDKQKKIISSTKILMNDFKITDKNIRFDVVEVIYINDDNMKINIIENAFIL